MSVRLVDASVAIKWVVAEEHTEQAAALFADALAARQQIVGPPHLRSEVINAIYQRTRRGEPSTRLNAEDGGGAVAMFLTFRINYVRSADLYRRAWALAHRHQIPTIYDSLYVALAEVLRTPLWTADRRLQRTMGSDYPLVRWIGDYGG